MELRASDCGRQGNVRGERKNVVLGVREKRERRSENDGTGELSLHSVLVELRTAVVPVASESATVWT